MNCQEAQLVMALRAVGGDSLTPDERAEFVAHVEACPQCAREYDEVCVILDQVGQALAEDLALTSDVPIRYAKPMMASDQGWEDLKRRVPSLAEACRRHERKQRFRQVAIRVGRWAVAACVLLAVGFGMTAWRQSRTRSTANDVVAHAYNNRNSDSTQCGIALGPLGSAVRVTENGCTPIAMNTPIRTHTDKQEILLGDMHRVVMNTESSVTIRADQHNGQLRYNLELAQGELYVEVIPGHPFTVKTPNANLIITGTKFDVRCDGQRTDLTLLKGSIHFGNANNEWTDVTAGHASSVMANASPTPPTETDALATTAWARDVAAKNALAKTRSDDLSEMVVSDTFTMPWPKLSSLDYATWTEKNQSWFEKEFPWIFQTQAAMKAQGVDVDYMTLLMISGDLWQFRYPCSANESIATLTVAGINRITKFYRLDASVLADVASHASKHDPQNTHEAMMNWQTAIRDVAVGNDLPNDLALFSLRATTYLNTTYTAAYLWIESHPGLAEKLLADPTTTFAEQLQLICDASADSQIDTPAKASTSQTHSPSSTSLSSAASPTLSSSLHMLKSRITAIQSAGTSAIELLTTPPATQCTSQRRDIASRLIKQLSSSRM
jgi:ferric-dicitrate binding protein FerR (iron transport regulator)